MTKHIGTWELVRVEAIDADGDPVSPAPFGGNGNYIGRVVLTTDRLSSTITDARPVLPDGVVREYSCYTGLYTFDGATLVTKVDQCSDPARMGTEQVRDVSFEDDLMVLRPPLQAYGERPAERRTLWWRKISDV